MTNKMAVIGDFDDHPVPNDWRLHSAGSRGVTFRCDFIGDVDSALEQFKRTMRPVLDAWPRTTIQMSITIG